MNASGSVIVLGWADPGDAGLARSWGFGEFRPDFLGVGVVEVFEDFQRFAPGGVGGGGVAEGVVGVADVVQDHRLGEPVTEFPGQPQRMVVAE